MDFFKSVFVEDPGHPSAAESEPESSSPPLNDPPPQLDGTAIGGRWSFGGLIKTLATRSESVLETYRRDLEEFGSGLKKETVTLREVASRAVKDLPSSIEISSSKAQGAFTSIADIIAQGKETLLAPDLDSSDSSDHVSGASNSTTQSIASGRYNRFDAQLRAIQCDIHTYADDPEDVDDFRNWRLGFDLGAKGDEIGDLMRENGAIGGIYKRLVPDSVDHEGFWSRYYYRFHRLQQAESVRANLVKRAISKEDEEELSWDVDDDDDDNDNNNNNNEEEGEEKKVDDSSNSSVDSPIEGTKELDSETSAKLGNVVVDQESSDTLVDEKKKKKVDVVESIKEELSNVELSSEGVPELSKIADEVVVPEVREEASSAPMKASPEEEDLGWDEIEDLGSDDDDDKKVVSFDRSELLRQRLNAAEDDEDLSWDIEDDDESIKS